MRPQSLGVIGLGAIGGSVAWTAAQKGIPRILGYSPIPAEGVAAMRAGALTEVVSTPRRIAQQCDLLVLAAPPAATMKLMSDLAGVVTGRECWITDVSSVKAPIARLAAEKGLAAQYAGSHPLAGTHESGFTAARTDLFRQAVVYVTPLPGGEVVAREVADFWSQVCAANPVIIDAEHHDAALAWTSHLPQAVASALAVACSRFGPGGMTYGPGARDTTRLAAGSVEMWRDILLMNRTAVLAALDQFDETVGDLRRSLQEGDADAVAAWFSEGAGWRADLGS